MPKNIFTRMSLPVRTAIAVGVAALFALLGCLLCAVIAQRTKDPTAHLTLYGEGVFLCTMLLCGFLCAKLAQENRFLGGLLPVGLLLLCIIAASIAFGGTSFVTEVILATLGAFCGTAGALLGSKEKRRKKRR